MAFLAGCSSGGGTTPNPPPIPTPIPTATPTPTATPGSSRPGLGLSAFYGGTLTVVDTNNVINTTPVTATTTSAVSNHVSTKLDGSGNTVFVTAESDVAQLRTTNVGTTTTVAYQPVAAGTNVRTLSSVATDSNGLTLETDYGANNGLVTVLPEVGGTTFSNDGALVYKETDPGINPGGVTTTNTVNADGSYTRLTNTIDGFGNPQVDTSTQTAALNGSYYIHELATPTSAGRAFTFTAPSGGNPPTIGYYNLTATNTLGSARAQTQPGYNWLAGVTALVSETDTITANQALDASCAPSAAYSKSSTLVKQVFTSYDIVFGSLETRTISSYDQPGPGTVCTVISDLTQYFYDYSQQSGNIRLNPAQTSTPVTSVQVNETLSLQYASTSSIARSPQSVSGGITLPTSVVASRIEAIVHQATTKRMLSLRQAGGNR